MLGSPWPTDRCLVQLRNCGHRTPLALSTVIPGARIPGKQHPRTRFGYRLAELAELDQRLEESKTRVDAVLCRLDGGNGPWAVARSLSRLIPLRQIGRVDWLLTLPGLRDADHSLLAAEALFAVFLSPGSRLYVDPLIDLDRTMDVRHGLLDPLCNPRSPFHVLRCLNTILHEFRSADFAATSRIVEGVLLLQLTSETATLSLLLPEAACSVPAELLAPPSLLYHLHRGTVERPSAPDPPRIDGPALLVARR
jgi:hypothetical protein